jgi:hypothetical protein
MSLSQIADEIEEMVRIRLEALDKEGKYLLEVN